MSLDSQSLSDKGWKPISYGFSVATGGDEVPNGEYLTS